MLDPYDRDVMINDLSYLASNPQEGVNLVQMVYHMRNMIEGFAR
jgi:hypothetical protein